MKKIFKELLDFIVPTILITVLLCVITFVPKSNMSQFISAQNYLRLLLDDVVYFDIYLKIFLNCLGVASIFYILKTIIKLKWNKTEINIAFFVLTFMSSSIVFYSTLHMGTLYGEAPYNHKAVDVVLQVSKYVENNLQLPLILNSLQVGITICFIFWLMDKVLINNFIKRINKI